MQMAGTSKHSCILLRRRIQLLDKDSSNRCNIRLSSLLVTFPIKRHFKPDPHGRKNPSGQCVLWRFRKMYPPPFHHIRRQTENLLLLLLVYMINLMTSTDDALLSAARAVPPNATTGMSLPEPPSIIGAFAFQNGWGPEFSRMNSELSEGLEHFHHWRR